MGAWSCQIVLHASDWSTQIAQQANLDQAAHARALRYRLLCRSSWLCTWRARRRRLLHCEVLSLLHARPCVHAGTAVCWLSNWCLLLQQPADNWKHVMATWRCLPRSNTPSCSPLCPLPLLPPSGEEYRSYSSAHCGGCCGRPCGWCCCGFCGRGGVDSAAMVRRSCARSLPCKTLVQLIVCSDRKVVSSCRSRLQAGCPFTPSDCRQPMHLQTAYHGAVSTHLCGDALLCCLMSA